MSNLKKLTNLISKKLVFLVEKRTTSSLFAMNFLKKLKLQILWLTNETLYLIIS